MSGERFPHLRSGTGLENNREEKRFLSITEFFLYFSHLYKLSMRFCALKILKIQLPGFRGRVFPFRVVVS